MNSAIALFHDDPTSRFAKRIGRILERKFRNVDIVRSSDGDYWEADRNSDTFVFYFPRNVNRVGVRSVLAYVLKHKMRNFRSILLDDLSDADFEETSEM